MMERAGMEAGMMAVGKEAGILRTAGTEAGTKEGIGKEAGMMEVQEVVCLEMEVCISEAGTGVLVAVLEARTWERVEIVTEVCSDFCHLQSEEDTSDITRSPLSAPGTKKAAVQC